MPFPLKEQSSENYNQPMPVKPLIEEINGFFDRQERDPSFQRKKAFLQRYNIIISKDKMLPFSEGQASFLQGEKTLHSKDEDSL
jgi:hypothetical protein